MRRENHDLRPVVDIPVEVLRTTSNSTWAYLRPARHLGQHEGPDLQELEEISLNPPNGPFVASTRLSEDVALEVLALEQGCRNEHWIRSWRSRTLFELSDLDSLVVAPTASPGTEQFHSLVLPSSQRDAEREAADGTHKRSAQGRRQEDERIVETVKPLPTNKSPPT